MTRPDTQHERILAIAPTTKGFGFAVLEDETTLVNWGVKSVRGNKNEGALKKIEELFSQYNPTVVVFENYRLTTFRRSARVRLFGDELSRTAKAAGIAVKTFSVQDVRGVFFGAEQGTKHAIAENLVQRFPDELGYLLPRKRLPWTTEDHRMAIFDAVALAMTFSMPETLGGR